MTTDQTNDRLEQLEIDLAHAQRTIDELNTVVTQQGMQIDRLTKRLAGLTDQMEELIETGLSPHQVEKPPHY